MVGQFILPSAVIPGMELHFVTSGQDFFDQVRKRQGNHGRRKKSPIESGSPTIQTTCS